MVKPIGLSGSLAFFWKNCYKVEVVFADKRIIDLKMKMETMMFFLTYAFGRERLSRISIVSELG